MNWVFPAVGMRDYDLCYPGAVYFGHICCFQGDVLGVFWVCILRMSK